MTTMTEQEQIRVLRESLEDVLNAQSSYQIAQHRDPTGSSRRCHAAAELVAAMDKAGQALDDTDPALSIQPVAAPEPVARLLHWNAPKHIPVPHGGICARTFAEFPKGAGENGGYWREGQPLYTAAPAQDAPDEVRDAALEALLTRIDDAWTGYERTGEICPFEGQPMIYASTLEEIVELRRALRTTSTNKGEAA